MTLPVCLSICLSAHPFVKCWLASTAVKETTQKYAIRPSQQGVLKAYIEPDGRSSDTSFGLKIRAKWPNIEGAKVSHWERRFSCNSVGCEFWAHLCCSCAKKKKCRNSFRPALWSICVFFPDIKATRMIPTMHFHQSLQELTDKRTKMNISWKDEISINWTIQYFMVLLSMSSSK